MRAVSARTERSPSAYWGVTQDRTSEGKYILYARTRFGRRGRTRLA
jgi:hypothetical protein